jgi:hypothetical protein
MPRDRRGSRPPACDLRLRVHREVGRSFLLCSLEPALKLVSGDRRPLRPEGRFGGNGPSKLQGRQLGEVLDECDVVRVVERTLISEALDGVGAAREEECGPEELTLGPISRNAIGKPDIVEQPGGDREERNLAGAEEDVAELSGFRIPDREVVFEELYLTTETAWKVAQQAVDRRPNTAVGAALRLSPRSVRFRVSGLGDLRLAWSVRV